MFNVISVKGWLLLVGEVSEFVKVRCAQFQSCSSPRKGCKIIVNICSDHVTNKVCTGWYKFES